MKKIVLLFISIFFLSSCHSSALRIYGLGIRYKEKYKIPGYRRAVEFEWELNLDRENDELIYYYGVCDTSIKLSYEYETLIFSYYSHFDLNSTTTLYGHNYETKDFIIYDSNRNKIEPDEYGLYNYKFNTNVFISYSHLPSYVIEEIESNDFNNQVYVNGWFYALVT